MILKYLMSVVLTAGLCAPAQADDHVNFVGLPLSMHPTELVGQLEQKGLEREDSNTLFGEIAGIDMLLRVNSSKDTLINNVMLTTAYSEIRNPQNDYAVLLRWMSKHYGKPTWQGSVRSYPFARWYVGFDKDIVMIVTGSESVEIWFYENHLKRNVDYYSILKYCERHPVGTAPHLTAHESVTWKSSSTPVVKRSKQRAHQGKRHAVRGKRHAFRGKNGATRHKKKARNRSRKR